jgi:DNA-binding CsgD family transcriptional regulator
VGADPRAVARIGEWLAGAAGSGVTQTADLELTPSGGAPLRLALIGRSGSNAMLARIAPAADASPAAALSAALGVTEREAEVLGWLARGKSNRDIAAILNLSPRTVTKHVEQIFSKIGVENRTAAAARAIRLIDG